MSIEYTKLKKRIRLARNIRRKKELEAIIDRRVFNPGSYTPETRRLWMRRASVRSLKRYLSATVMRINLLKQQL